VRSAVVTAEDTVHVLAVALARAQRSSRAPGATSFTNTPAPALQVHAPRLRVAVLDVVARRRAVQALRAVRRGQYLGRPAERARRRSGRCRHRCGGGGEQHERGGRARNTVPSAAAAHRSQSTGLAVSHGACSSGLACGGKKRAKSRCGETSSESFYAIFSSRLKKTTEPAEACRCQLQRPVGPACGAGTAAALAGVVACGAP
jgi:hypothetical protein